MLSVFQKVQTTMSKNVITIFTYNSLIEKHKNGIRTDVLPGEKQDLSTTTFSSYFNCHLWI